MNKIVKNLNAEELQEFFQECAQTKGLTLEAIQDLAKKRGIQISLMSAKNFREGALNEWRAKLQRATEVSGQIETLLEQGTANSFADASAVVLGQMVFDILMTGEDGVDINTLSKIISRLRTGDHAQRNLEMKIAEYERAEAERQKQVEALKAKAQKAKEAGGLTEDAQAVVDELILGM